EQRSTLDGDEAERANGRNAIDERVGVQVARARSLVRWQAPVDTGRAGIADAAAVLNVAGTARHGEREAILQREDAAKLPAAQHQIARDSALQPPTILDRRDARHPTS